MDNKTEFDYAVVWKGKYLNRLGDWSSVKNGFGPAFLFSATGAENYINEHDLKGGKAFKVRRR